MLERINRFFRIINWTLLVVGILGVGIVTHWNLRAMFLAWVASIHITVSEIKVQYQKTPQAITDILNDETFLYLDCHDPYLDHQERCGCEARSRVESSKSGVVNDKLCLCVNTRQSLRAWREKQLAEANASAP